MDASRTPETLPLDPLVALLPLDRPFTRGTAAAAGIGRRPLERLLAAGSVRRLLRGVYVAATAGDTPALRAAAVALAARPGTVVVERTAGWVHGLDDLTLGLAGAGDAVPLDTVPTGARGLVARDLRRCAVATVTTPLRTALDLGRLLPDDRAIAALDALAARDRFTHTALLAELPRFAGCTGVGRLRRLAPVVDARAAGPAESVLRLHWLAAPLPTPVPGLRVVAGTRLVRLALGVPDRRFGVALDGQVPAAGLVALQGRGWRVVVLAESRVRRGDPGSWARHLEREFHQQLLAQVG